MKRLILLVALVMAMAVLAPAAFADDDVAEPEDTEMTEKDLSAAQLWKAQMIADYVGFIESEDPEYAADQAEVDAVLLVREGPPSVGWGVLFKLQAYEAAGMDPTEFLMDGDGYALGEIRKLYLAGEYRELPYKNLGQLQKSVKDDEAGKSGKVPPGQEKKDKTNS